MHALVLEDIGRLVVTERPTPSVGPHEVLIAISAVGICGSDLHGFTGESGRRHPGQVMGHEAAGTVAALGSDVTDLRVGEAVTFNPLIACGHCRGCAAGEQQHCESKTVIGVDPTVDAAFADFIAVPAGNVIRLPPDLPTQFGALVEPLAVAFHAVMRAGVRADDRVLVLGGGPIGQSVVLAAQSAGASAILVSEPDGGRRDLCRRLGARTIDPHDGPVAQQVSQLFGSAATIAIDAVGVSATLAAGLNSTRVGSTVLLVGMGSPTVDLAAYEVSVSERTIIGSFCYSEGHFRAAVAWASANPESLRPLVSSEIPAADAQSAFERLGVQPPPGKVLLRFPIEGVLTLA